MHTKIPPPIIGVITGLAIWLLDNLAPDLSVAFFGQTAVAVLVAGLGLALDLTALGFFRRDGTTIDPRDPDKTSSLVVGGPYRISRNPMYLGLLLILLGWALFLGNPLGLVVLAAFVCFITIYQIKAEEAALRAKFGTDFEAYCKSVRRWI